MSPTEAAISSLDAARERLAAAKMYMRYDYAWKETEFRQADQRMTGIACRLLYLHEMWRHTAASKRSGAKIEELGDGDEPAASTDAAYRTMVWIDANGYPDFAHQVEAACALMGVDVLSSTADDADAQRACAQLVFVYVSPHGEARVDNEYAAFEAITKHHHEQQTDADKRPLFFFLLGEAAFLEPPATAEVERLRGLSGFAISQRFTPLLESAKYTSVAEFAVEFTPQKASTHGEADLSDIMNQFGCMDHNMMRHTEKWGCYGFGDSELVTDDELAQAPEDEARYWLESTHGKICDQCLEWNDKLLRCSRCQTTFYCSRECQKAAWKLHKRLCGKSADEISGQSPAT